VAGGRDRNGAAARRGVGSGRRAHDERLDPLPTRELGVLAKPAMLEHGGADDLASDARHVCDAHLDCSLQSRQRLSVDVGVAREAEVHHVAHVVEGHLVVGALLERLAPSDRRRAVVGLRLLHSHSHRHVLVRLARSEHRQAASAPFHLQARHEVLLRKLHSLLGQARLLGVPEQEVFDQRVWRAVVRQQHGVLRRLALDNRIGVGQGQTGRSGPGLCGAKGLWE